MPSKKADQKTAKDYEQLGRQIESTYLSGALDRKRLIINSFIRGVSAGLGTVIGATIVLALLLWILSALEEVPLLGPVFDNIETTIEEKQ